MSCPLLPRFKIRLLLHQNDYKIKMKLSSSVKIKKQKSSILQECRKSFDFYEKIKGSLKDKRQKLYSKSQQPTSDKLRFKVIVGNRELNKEKIEQVPLDFEEKEIQQEKDLKIVENDDVKVEEEKKKFILQDKITKKKKWNANRRQYPLRSRPKQNTVIDLSSEQEQSDHDTKAKIEQQPYLPMGTYLIQNYQQNLLKIQKDIDMFLTYKVELRSIKVVSLNDVSHYLKSVGYSFKLETCLQQLLRYDHTLYEFNQDRTAIWTNKYSSQEMENRQKRTRVRMTQIYIEGISFLEPSEQPCSKD